MSQLIRRALIKKSPAGLSTRLLARHGEESRAIKEEVRQRGFANQVGTFVFIIVSLHCELCGFSSTLGDKKGGPYPHKGGNTADYIKNT